MDIHPLIILSIGIFLGWNGGFLHALVITRLARKHLR